MQIFHRNLASCNKDNLFWIRYSMVIEKRGCSCTACLKKWDGAKVWSVQTCIDRTNVTRYSVKQFISLAIMNNAVVCLLCLFELVIQKPLYIFHFLKWIPDVHNFILILLCHWFPTKTFCHSPHQQSISLCMKFGICLHSQEKRQLSNRMFSSGTTLLFAYLSES